MSRPHFASNQEEIKPTQVSIDRAKNLVKRQYIRFAFYKIDPLWRRLEPQIQIEHKKLLFETIKTFNRRMLLRPYSTVGTRADTEILLWQIAETPIPFQELSEAIMKTPMGGFLELTHSYFSQTKRSIYEIPANIGNTEDPEERLIIDPTEAKYLFVYPFVKTRAWYQLSLSARQGMINEHIIVGKKYPSVKLNTTYAYGLDDYEFVLAFETDEPSDFLDLVQELRETTVSAYTKQDTPIFTCLNMRLDQALDAIGGPQIAEEIKPGETKEVWLDVCPLKQLGPGETKIVYLEGKQIGVFNLNGEIYAINNRCSHARGPLTEGEINAKDCTVVCPWHYAKFDIKTGKVIDGLATTSLNNYKVEIRDENIWIGAEIIYT